MMVDGRAAAADTDVGAALAPNGDWWTFDTCHVGNPHVQARHRATTPPRPKLSSSPPRHLCFELPRPRPPTIEQPQVISNSSVDSGVGVYWMFYSGADFSVVGQGDRKEKGLLVRPGLALSQDGRNWARVEGGHHTGALLDVGPKGAFDAGGVSEPNVRPPDPTDTEMPLDSVPLPAAAR